MSCGKWFHVEPRFGAVCGGGQGNCPECPMPYEEWAPLAHYNGPLDYKLYVFGFYMDKKFRQVLFGATT